MNKAATSKSTNRMARSATVLGLVTVVVFCLLRLVHLEADLPWGITWSGAVYADEGIYNRNAAAYTLTGQWHIAGEWNTAVNYPVISTIQALVYSTFGVSLRAARAIPVGCAIVAVLTVYWLTQRYVGTGAALLAALLCASNYLLFCYSRFANTDVPMLTAALLTVTCALYRVEPTPAWSVALAGVCAVSAILCKTSAVFVLPVVILVIWLGNSTGRRRVALSALFGSVLGVGLLAWYVLLVHPYWDDFDAVVTTLTMSGCESSEGGILPRALAGILGATRPDFSIEGNVFQRVAAGIIRGTYAGPSLYPLALLFGVALLLLAQDRRRRLLVLASLAWLAAYLLMIGVRGHFPPRYYSVVVPPVAILISVGLAALPATGRVRYATGAIAVLVACAAAHNGYRIVDYLCHPRYSLRDMGRSVREHVAVENLDRPLLLGNTAGTYGLIASLPSVGEHLGPGDEAFKVRTHHPTHLISMGPAGAANPATTAALRAAGYRWELIERYDVYGNFRENARTGVYFYRLKPPRCGFDSSSAARILAPLRTDVPRKRP